MAPQRAAGGSQLGDVEQDLGQLGRQGQAGPVAAQAPAGAAGALRHFVWKATLTMVAVEGWPRKRTMSVGFEALFTSALGLQMPWVVEDVKVNTAKRRIDFEVGRQGGLLACPACGAGARLAHDRLRRSWRQLDFFQFEAWVHCDVPRRRVVVAARPTR